MELDENVSFTMENTTSQITTVAAKSDSLNWCTWHSNLTPPPLFLVVSYYIIIAINVILSISTIFGNILVLISLPKITRIHAASKALYCSLAVSDLGVGLFVQPFFVGGLVSGREGLTSLCNTFEIVINVVGVISVGVSLQTLSAISVDRLLALRLKMRYKECASLKRIRTVLVICWLLSSLHAAMLFISPAFFSVFQVLGILMCLGVSTVSYVIIYRTLRQHQNQVQSYDSGGESQQNTFNIALYKKTISPALWIYGFLLVCYLPFMLGIVAQIFVGVSVAYLGIQWFATSLLYMNSSLNPLLYCWKIPEVRQVIKNILRRRVDS